MARSCFTPDGNEALGIGSRTHLYAQSLLIVFISLIVRKRSKPHTTVTYLWRLQLYTFGALAIACICQRSKGKLSMFYEIVTYHTGALLLWSAIVGVMIQKGDSPLTLQHYVPVSIGTSRKKRKIDIALPTLTPWFIFLGCLTYMALAWVIFYKDSSCDHGTGPGVRWKLLWTPPPLTINGTDKGSLWVLLDLFVPMVAFILVPFVLRTAPCCKHFFSSFCANVLPVTYLLFWVNEIYGIETSMMINSPPLDRSAQFELNFGQILSLVLVMPYMERVFNEFFEMYRTKKFLKNERSTESIPNA